MPARPRCWNSDHHFMFLRQHRDHVHPAVAVDIAGDCAHGAWSRIDRERRERRTAPIGGAVLENLHAAGLPIAKGADQQIEVAVAVEIGGLDVRDTRQTADRRGCEPALAQSPQPDHRTLVVIARQELAEVGHEQVLDAVAIEIDDLAARRIRQLCDRREARGRIVRTAKKHHAVSHVAHDQLQPGIAVEIDQLHVRHHRRRRGLRRRQTSSHEDRRAILGRPCRRWRERRRSVGFIPRQCRGDVGAEGRRTGVGLLLRAVLYPLHANDFVAPGRLRQDVGRRQPMAGTAQHRGRRPLLIARAAAGQRGQNDTDCDARRARAPARRCYHTLHYRAATRRARFPPLAVVSARSVCRVPTPSLRPD